MVNPKGLIQIKSDSGLLIKTNKIGMLKSDCKTRDASGGCGSLRMRFKTNILKYLIVKDAKQSMVLLYNGLIIYLNMLVLN